ncbi:MAG: CRISPR-associated endonuclease Cas1, partial [Sulfolobales archaeon]
DLNNLQELRKEVMEIEAHGARLYWSSIAYILPKEVGFSGREQDAHDQVNIALNYGYGILYTECWKALTLAGLDPYAGFLHTERSGKPVLVFDLVEMFRATAVDSVIISKFREGWGVEVTNNLISPKSRSEIIKLIRIPK